MIENNPSLKDKNFKELEFLENCLIQLELLNPKKSVTELLQLRRKFEDYLKNDQNIISFRDHLTCVQNDMNIFTKSVIEPKLDEYKRNILLNKEHLKNGSQRNDRMLDFLVSNDDFQIKIMDVIKKASRIVPKIISSMKPLRDSTDSMLNLKDSDFFIRGTIMPPWHQLNKVLAKYLLLKEEYEKKLRHEYSLIEIIENKDKCIKI